MARQAGEIWKELNVFNFKLMLNHVKYYNGPFRWFVWSCKKKLFVLGGYWTLSQIISCKQVLFELQHTQVLWKSESLFYWVKVSGN